MINDLIFSGRFAAGDCYNMRHTCGAVDANSITPDPTSKPSANTLKALSGNVRYVVDL